MYIFFTDETNTNPENDENVIFFAYGGLLIPMESINELDEGIKKIREEAGYKPENEFKFNTNSRPNHITNEIFSKSKNEVIELCIRLRCKFIVYVVLHDIAKTQGLNKTIIWGADHIVGKFNFFLKKSSSTGFVIVDRMSNLKEYKFLSDKFTKGLTLFNGKTVSLPYIKLFGSSCSNASNLSSAMDIVLGSFRYCINNPINTDSAKKMMSNIVKIIWAETNGKDINPFELGLTFRPSNIKVPKYQKKYDDLIKHINSLL